ncbi:MAG: hypothetical protein JO228_01845 [Xanthobacteraceae bacterium]|nr:hypothetical protein [Xanthobacteraceae bacterium]
MRRICKLTSGAIALAAALVAYSTASFAVGTAEQRAACTPDALRLCSAEIPNIPRIVACLRANRSNLSKPCQSALNSPTAAQF